MREWHLVIHQMMVCKLLKMSCIKMNRKSRGEDRLHPFLNRKKQRQFVADAGELSLLWGGTRTYVICSSSSVCSSLPPLQP